ncbi:UDP-2,4-diacetamido-2,4,6-trideoxy-beta-L-altropyranose hydrolase [Kurthia gibsonii]|uniref:UDP-2,4-diacetamido-2,4, 6-trideoxy-beta-L-altropyranose hydrolase n=1 Tax=Kurthia gibsonii TaxID=33946 RepID=UPI0034CEE60A
MNIVFRTDSSYILGSGHVMRCLTLAKELKLKHNISFICSNHEGNLISTIKNEGFIVYEIPKCEIRDNNNDSYLAYEWEKDIYYTNKVIKNINYKIDCFIIDHYMLDYRWEKKLPKSSIIAVIDDLGNRKHYCELLIDQNYSEFSYNKYENLVFNNPKLLLGEKYALLRDEFLENKKSDITDIKKIMIYFGASDLTNETFKVLTAHSNIDSQLHLEVLLGQSNIRKNELIREFHNSRNIRFINHNIEISSLMSKADLSIGAGGSTTWERCCFGLPSVVVTTAENQINPMKELAKKGLIHLLEHSSIEAYEKILVYISRKDILYWRKIQKKGMDFFDGNGKKRIRYELERVYKSRGFN